MNFTLGKYDIDLNFRACRKWTDPRWFKHRNGDRQFVWGRLSVHVEDWAAEKYALCAECGSDEIGEIGDCTVCAACQSIEQGYRYVNKREYGEKFG